MKTVKLVATAVTIKRLFPKEFHTRYGNNLMHNSEWMPDGPVSADFPIDPNDCKSKFGRWLAETIPTTRFDDDFSTLRLTLRATEEDLHVQEAFERLGAMRIRCKEDFQTFQRHLQDWLKERRSFFEMYGDSLFKPRIISFQWPVFGSADCREASTPPEFFDLCAARIRALKPAAVTHFATKAEPPESLQLTRH